MSRKGRSLGKGHERTTTRSAKGPSSSAAEGRARSGGKGAPPRPSGSRLIIGWNPALEALRAGVRPHKIWLAAEQNKQVEELRVLAGEQGVPVEVVDKQVLTSLAGSEEHQGVVAAAPPYVYRTVDEILDHARSRGEDPFLLVLDHIEDPHNLGSLIRTAECAGVHGVIIPKRRAAAVTPAVGKASAGAIEHVRVAQVVNIVQELERLKAAGLWSIAADMGGERTLYEADLRGPIVLVIGSEGKGVSRLVAERCDMLVRIPMWGNINSLNASVAGALLMYEVARTRLRNISNPAT